MRSLQLLLTLLVSLGLLACTPRGGRGGGGGGDDDDSAGDDDDATNDDDDDATNDDDDDATNGDDDDSVGGVEVTSNAGGTYTLEFDFDAAATSELGWEDCQRAVTLTQVTGVIETGCPSCDFVMRLDSSSVNANCDPDTGITEDPMTGIQFGVALSDGDLRFWNYQDSVWGTFIEGGSSSSSGYAGDTGWESFDFDVDGTVYDYESRVQVNITWN